MADVCAHRDRAPDLEIEEVNPARDGRKPYGG